MKKEIWLYLIGAFFMLVLYSVSIHEFYGEWVSEHLDAVHTIPKECKSGANLPKEICEEYEYYLNKYDDKKPDAFTGFYNSVLIDIRLCDIFALLICFTSIYFISKEFKGKTLYTYLQRNDYKSYIKRIFKRAYKYILYYIPVFLVIFLICVCLSGNFDINLALDVGFFTWPEIYRENAIINTVLFLLNYVLLNSILISLALMCVRKFINPIISTLAAYLSYVVLCAGSEIIGYGIYKIFDLDIIKYLNIMNAPYNVDLVMWKYSLFLFFIAGILFLITWLIYKNKEKMIISLEKYSKE